MRTVLLLILVISCCNLKGQSWFPNDAVWHYTHTNGYVKISYDKDTIHSGHVWKQFTSHNGFISPIHLLDTLGIQYVYTSAFSDTIYDFSKNIGDYYTFNGLIECNKAQIIDTGIIVINSIPLKYQVVKYTDCVGATFYPSDTLVEFIGSIGQFIHPYYLQSNGFSSGHPESGSFRCYEDSIIGNYINYINYLNGSTTCDWLTAVNESILNSFSVHVFPNPTKETLIIKFDRKIPYANIVFKNSIGKIIFNKDIYFESEVQATLSDQANGIYFISINTNTFSATKKVIIE
jgi:hypothetical protein